MRNTAGWTWIALAALAGCGGGQAQTQVAGDSTDPRMRRMMEFEAEMAARRDEIASAGGDCGFICRESEISCQHSDNICQLADDMRGDAQAASKCQSAKQECTSQRTTVQSRCGGCERVDTPGYAPPMD